MRRSIQQNTLAHAYLFSGQEHLGKKTVALEFAKILQCEKEDSCSGSCRSCRDISQNRHPDVVFIEPDKLDCITISRIRELRRVLSLHSFGGKYKIAVIDQAQRLNGEAANALLKTLEEPRENSIIILVASDSQSLPETIISRTQHIRFSPVDRSSIYEYFSPNQSLKGVTLDDLINLSQGRPGIIFNFLENPRYFSEFKQEISQVIQLFHQDLDKRLRHLENLKIFGDFRKNLENLHFILHNLLIQESGEADYLIPSFLRKEIKIMTKKFSLSRIIEIAKFVQELNKIFSKNANFSHRLAMEALMLKI